MAPLLSVIVPAYGVGEYLPACLDTILASTLRDLEVVVVDDGSPDECGEIADDYARVDDRVKVLHTENQGLGEARNTGAEVATGRYITFADSDDLIPPRAYELMVRSLESTGSDIAAGNAWRYIEGRGNVQSWTHAEAFEETRLATHVREFPLLIRDRMVWNKVYRRSFWDEGGYRFPPIRYEDYPVTLRAHIEAGSVDVLSDKVYLWRQRLAEDSITQRSLELDNITDRITSATMTLEVADAEGGEIRERIHAYFTEVDIVTVATAIANAEDPEERAEIERMAVEFARALAPDVEGPTRLPRAIHKLLRQGDTATAAALAQWRLTREHKALLESLTSPQTLKRFPSVARGLGLGQVRLPSLSARKLKVRLMEFTRAHDSSSFQVEVNLRRVFLDKARFRVSLVSEDREIPLAHHVVAISGQRATMEIELPDVTVGSLWGRPMQLIVRAEVALVSWRGEVTSSRGDLPLPYEVGEDWCVVSHASKGGPSLWVRRVPAANVADVELSDDEIRVHVDSGHERVAVLRPAPSRPLIRKVIDGVATFELDRVLDDPADDPVTSRAYRDIVALETETARRLQPGGVSATQLVGAATGGDEGAISTGGTGGEPLGSLETDVVPAGLLPEDTEDDANQGTEQLTVEQVLDRTGITPLVLREHTRKRLAHGEHVVEILRSRTGTAELAHQRIDHLPR